MGIQFIHHWIFSKVSTYLLLTTFVYGLDNIVNQRRLWSALKQTGEDTTDTWLVIEDFNVMLTVEDKTDRLLLTHYELQDLEDLVYNKSLMDIQSIGCRFTWTIRTISCKLDYAMVNTCWLLEDFHGYRKFLPPGCLSNHSCFDTTRWAENMTSFKFFNMWALHENFLMFR